MRVWWEGVCVCVVGGVCVGGRCVCVLGCAGGCACECVCVCVCVCVGGGAVIVCVWEGV